EALDLGRHRPPCLGHRRGLSPSRLRQISCFIGNHLPLRISAQGVETMPDSIKFWGLLIHKERWGLSRRGVLVAGVPAIATGFLLFLGIHPFLAVTHRVD